MSTPSHDTIFYTLPARLVEEGMSTAFAQDVVRAVEIPGLGLIYIGTCDPTDEDREDSEDVQSGYYRPDEPVSLATYIDTDVDGSDRPEARIEVTA